MRCPGCGADYNVVRETRNRKPFEVYRRRECEACGLIFPTWETISWRSVEKQRRKK